MLFKSQVYTQASGSIGGITYAHNAGGAYTRARSIPTNPNTARQQIVRNLMAQLTSAWQETLTPAQRLAWKVYSDNVTLPNPLGDPINTGAATHYYRSNVPRMQGGAARQDDAPTTFNLGDMTPATFAASAATALLSVTFDNTDSWANEDDAHALVYCSAPQAPTINYFKGPYRYLDGIDGDSITPPTSPADFATLHTLTAGQKLFVQIRVSRADGRLSSPFRGSCVIAA
jgi:hypothetical protein